MCYIFFFKKKLEMKQGFLNVMWQHYIDLIKVKLK